jgi:ribosomal protein L14E/L6E/L27E
MAFIEAGKACVITKGRRRGRKVTISKVVDDRFVVVKDEKGKERKASVMHLMPAEKK